MLEVAGLVYALLVDVCMFEVARLGFTAYGVDWYGRLLRYIRNDETQKQTRQWLYTTTDPNDVEHLSDATNRLEDFPSRAFDQGIPKDDQGDAAFLVEFSHWPAQPSTRYLQ